MLRRKPVVHIKRNHVPRQIMHDAFARVMVRRQPAKHPPSTVEVDVRTPFLRLPVRTVLRRRLEDADRDLAALDWTFLLGDAVHVRSRRAPVGDLVPRWIGAEVFDGHLVRMVAADVVPVVVLDIDGVEARGELGGDAVQERLVKDPGLQVMKCRVSGL